MSSPLRRFALVLVVAAVLVVALGVVAPGAAEARPRPSPGARFTANKTFGLGLMLGAPSGLTGKYFLGPDFALDFGVGAVRYYRGRDGLHLHGDLLWHPVSLASVRAFELPLYLGVGARIFDFDDDGDDAFAFGVRGPIGISFDFNEVPLDAFFELALVVDFYSDYVDDVGADLNAAIGVRYYFN